MRWQLLIAVLAIGAIQVACNYLWMHPRAVIAQRVERIHLDVTAGVIYATLGTQNGGSTTIAMTPRAAVQLQVEIGRMAAEAERRSKQVSPQL